MKKNNISFNKLFIKCEKVLKMYPPAKNEYKFIYGNLIQMIVIELLDNIFFSNLVTILRGTLFHSN